MSDCTSVSVSFLVFKLASHKNHFPAFQLWSDLTFDRADVFECVFFLFVCFVGIVNVCHQ